MALDAATPRVVYDGNGSVSAYNVQDADANPIYFAANSEIHAATYVVSTGVWTDLVEGVGYTLAGGPTSGVLTLSAGNLATGTKLVIWRETVLSQDDSFGAGGNFSSTTHNSVAQRHRRIDQEIDDAVDRALKLDRAELAYDAGGKAVEDVLYLDVKEATAPGTPASGYGRVYTKTDGKLYHKDDAGTETNISGQVALAAAQVVLAEAQVALAEAQVALATAQAAAAASSATDAQTAEDAAEAAQAAAEAAQAATEAALVAAGLPDDLAGQALKILQVNAGETGYQFATGGGDVAGPASSVDNEIALFDSTTGKLLKRASTTGLLKATSGVIAAASAGTDYLAPSAIANMLETDDIGVTVQAYDADTAKLDTAQTFTAVQKADALALTHNTAWSGAKQRLTADVDGSAFTIANPTADTAITGAVYRIRVAYTTAHSIAWGSAFKGVLGIVPTATAGAVDHFAFEYNGTDFECIGYRLNAKVT